MRQTGTFLVLAALAAGAWAHGTGMQRGADNGIGSSDQQMSSSSSASGGMSSSVTTTYGGNLGMSSDMRDVSGMNQGASDGRAGQGMVTSDGGIALKTDEVKANGSVPAVSGGVSLNARDTMRSDAPKHNVKMVFALNTGNYVSDVHVTVTDKNGRAVIDDTSNGPWMLANLAPGSYTANATYNGITRTQRFTVGKSGMKTAQFRWPASAESSVGASGAVDAGGQILGTGPEEPREQR